MARMQKQIAELAGVSTATVSRAFTKSTGVNPETLNRIRDAMVRLGLDASVLANQGRDIFSNYVLVCAAGISDERTSRIVEGICRKLEPAGYRVVLHVSFGSKEKELSAMQKADSNGYMGIICLTAGNDGAIDEYMRRPGRRPAVLADKYIRELDFDSARCDYYRSAAAAVGLLVRNGHKRIAFIGGEKSASPSQDALRGYADAMNSFGIAAARSDVCFCGTADGFGKSAGELLSGGVAHSAAVITGQEIAARAARYLRDIGKRVPEDFSIVCLEDGFAADKYCLNLTSIDCAGEDVGTAAAELLIRRAFEPRGDGERVLLPPKETLRGSVRDLNAECADSAESILWIS